MPEHGRAGHDHRATQLLVRQADAFHHHRLPVVVEKRLERFLLGRARRWFDPSVLGH